MKKRSYPLIIFLALALCSTAKEGVADEPVYEPTYEDDILYLQPLKTYQSFTVTVNGPDQIKYRLHFRGDETPQLTLHDEVGRLLPDGLYTFELKASPIVSEAKRAQLFEARTDGVEPKQLPEGKTQSGSFYVADGVMVLPETKSEDPIEGPRSNVVFAEDLVIIGKQCVGLGCVDGESFGDDMLRLKHYVLRMNFVDTSDGAYPGNDWRLLANDLHSGGLNYFGIEDANTGRIPFRVEAGSPANALYVDAAGELGIGTSTPQREMHLVSSNSPTIRLEQDNSAGFGTQTWDLTSDETNFYIGDASNGNKLPFRIEVNSPTNSLYIANDGVGVNTYNPSAQLDVVGSSELNGDVGVTGVGVDFTIRDTTPTANTRYLMKLENKGPIIMDLFNTDRNIRWELGVDNQGFKIKNSIAGGAFLQLRGNAVELTGNLNVSGDTELWGGLNVSGDTLLENITALGNLHVFGTTVLSGLNVRGTTSLEGVTAQGDLNVSGTTTLGNVHATAVSVSGATALNDHVTVAGNAVDLTIRDTTTTPGGRSLLNLENHGRTWLDFSNTYRDNRWRIGADHFGFRIRDNSPTGRGVCMEFANTGNVSVWSDIGEHLRITSTGDLIIRGEILTGGGSKALSAENEAMKLQIKALENLVEAQEARLQTLEAASGKR